MKKQTINTLTSWLGIILIMSVIPLVFYVTENLGVILPSFIVGGLFLIWFKNDDAKAQITNILTKSK